ncbi:hypothetical protein BU16DRAFT_474205 [Lophium mytilinum]|uniref:ML-like domain-containing protein n=1 Tax=Lophium mytilinum TaxID=390894 RepID=A0A6A6QA35_9PEZI|nr:hypothetical protein BU16DRAFT_474205 [Lophium mytilinum]
MIPIVRYAGTNCYRLKELLCWLQRYLPRRPRVKQRASRPFSPTAAMLMVIILIAFPVLTSGVFINFENCLDASIRDPGDGTLVLQFTPFFFDARFNTSTENYNMNITIYGNVSGQATMGPYPPPDDPAWSDPKVDFGKIVDESPTNPKLTTLYSTFNVASYTPYADKGSEFCLSTVNASCPIAPSFKGNASDPYSLPGYTVGHNFLSSYSFTTFATTIRVDSGDVGAPHLACVSANITPDLGDTISDTLTYLPAAVLALVAIATIFAAIFCPWGSSDPFRWTSNFGRDEDLLRLVTPGFGDCLQYIQFIVLAGSLNLDYPGFYQPVVSQASWSVLLFNQSLVSHGNGSRSLVDGIYVVNGTYGLSRLGELVGMTEEIDIWAGFTVWLLGLIAVVVVICQFGFLLRLLVRRISHTQGSDLRSKNLPFTGGNIVRILLNFFLLPILALSFFQLVVAPHSPASVVAGAVILIIAVTCLATWISWFIFTTRPRAFLFDDLPTVLAYGPLYNTYSDDAAPFAFIPVLVNTIRGVAIGAIQPSGIAQVIMLAISEVILILTLHAFRPFQSNTSMNAYHTFFSTVRLATTLLSVAFVPTLGISEGPKGWIGYIILLLHASVLVFGFFLNSLQTLIEVAARLAGAGGESRGGLSKVFGMRELSRRNRHTHRKNQRSSLNSTAAMLSPEIDSKSVRLMGGRSRSLSQSSAILLNQQLTGSHRGSVGFDQLSQGGDLNAFGAPSPTPGTPGGPTPFSYLGGSSAQGSRRPTLGTNIEAMDPYYRPPRARRPTNPIDPSAPGNRSRGSAASAELANTPYADSIDQAEEGDAGEGPSSFSPGRSSIAPAYLRMNREDSDPTLSEHRKTTDYTVRESDFYYGIRGPALSTLPTRKLKTGPADPMGPVSSASGWFKTLLGGKRKEKGKGFEVVRSTRMPPQMVPLGEDEETSPVPYQDSPDVEAGAAASISLHEERGRDLGSADHHEPSIMDNASGYSMVSDDDPFDHQTNRVSDIPPMLLPIETGGGIELPSRIGSRASKASRATTTHRAPTIPRKSSRRTASTDRAILEQSQRLSTVVASPPGTPGMPSMSMQVPADQHLQPNILTPRLPFGSSDPSPERTPGHSAASSLYPRSEGTDPGQTPNTLLPPAAANTQGDRPVSTGYVHQRIASDSIQQGDYSIGSHLESAAELVDARSRSISTNRSGHS